MFGLPALDLILGLIFIYLLLALVCTAANELIAQWLNWRPATLREGIRTLLGNSAAVSEHAARIRFEKSKQHIQQAEALVERTHGAELKQLREARQKRQEAVTRADRAAAAHAAARAHLTRAQADLARNQMPGSSAPVIPELQKLATSTAAAAVDLEQRKNEVAAARATVDSLEGTLRKHAPVAFKLLTAAEQSSQHNRAALLTQRLFGHPLIHGLSQLRRSSWLQRQQREPSYIPSSVFATALLDLVAPADTDTPSGIQRLRLAAERLPAEIGKPLLHFVNQAGDELENVGNAVERWYADAMERVSGLYKRKLQLLTVIVGSVIVLALNADTLIMVRQLGNDAALRSTLVAYAERVAATPPPTDTPAIASLQSVVTPAAAQVPDSIGEGAPTAAAGDQSAPALREPLSVITATIDTMKALGVPLGWTRPILPPSITDATGFIDTARAVIDEVPHLLTRMLGLLLTILAVSLGAPFWFDMLNKVINIRSSGRAPEERTKPPEALPPARGA
jgi:hypothetical protein